MVISKQESQYIVNSKFRDGVSGPAQKAFGNFQRVSGAALRAAVLGVAAVTAGLVAMTQKALVSFDAIGKFADRIGITTDKLQEYRFAFDKAGVSQEKVDKGLLEFEKRFGKAQFGFGALAESLKRVDKELLNNIVSSNNGTEALEKIFNAMGRAESQAIKLAIADAAFGKVGLQMTAAFKDGTATFQDWMKKARELGIVVDEELIRKSERINDEMSLLGDVVKLNFQSGLIEGFVDDFGGLHKMLTDPNFREGVNNLGEVMGGFLRFLVENSKEIAITSASLAALFLAAKLGTAVGLKKNIALIATLLAGLTAGVLVYRELAEAAEDADAKMSFQKFAPPSVEGPATEKIEKSTELIQTQFYNLTHGSIPDLEERHDSFIDNAIRGMENYASSVGTVGDRISFAFTGAFQEMEDSLVQFIKTGEINFSNFVDQLITDLIRFQVRQAITLPFASFGKSFLTELLGKGLQGTSAEGLDLGGSGFNSPLISGGGSFPAIGTFGANFGRAIGGPVQKGRSFVVGERGREIFTPNEDGRIIPNQGGGSQVNIIINNNAKNTEVGAQQRKTRNGVNIELMISEAGAKDIRSGGPMHRAIRQTFATNVRLEGR